MYILIMLRAQEAEEISKKVRTGLISKTENYSSSEDIEFLLS